MQECFIHGDNIRIDLLGCMHAMREPAVLHVPGKCVLTSPAAVAGAEM